jgi:hypothetical protein
MTCGRTSTAGARGQAGDDTGQPAYRLGRHGGPPDQCQRTGDGESRAEHGQQCTDEGRAQDGVIVWQPEWEDCDEGSPDNQAIEPDAEHAPRVVAPPGQVDRGRDAAHEHNEGLECVEVG